MMLHSYPAQLGSSSGPNLAAKFMVPICLEAGEVDGTGWKKPWENDMKSLIINIFRYLSKNEGLVPEARLFGGI